MTYIEDTRTLYLDDSQPLHQASATYKLMRQEWERGPTNVRLDGWLWPNTLILRHVASRN